MGHALAQLYYTCFIAYSDSRTGDKRVFSGSSYFQETNSVEDRDKILFVPFVGLERAIERLNENKKELSRAYDKAEIFAVDKDHEYLVSDITKIFKTEKPIKTFNLDWVEE